MADRVRVVNACKNFGTVVALTAIPETGFRVKQWVGTDNDDSPANSNTRTKNFVISLAFCWRNLRMVS